MHNGTGNVLSKCTNSKTITMGKRRWWWGLGYRSHIIIALAIAVSSTTSSSVPFSFKVCTAVVQLNSRQSYLERAHQRAFNYYRRV